jgi:hypothetical protein
MQNNNFVVLYGWKIGPSYYGKVSEMALENRVLRKVFGPKSGEVVGDWRKLHNEKLRDLYALPNIIGVIKSKSMRLEGHVACIQEELYAYRALVGKSKINNPFGRFTSRLQDNIKVEFKEIRWKRVDRIHLA